MNKIVYYITTSIESYISGLNEDMLNFSSRLLFSIFFVLCMICNNCNLLGQDIQQITSAESQQYDSNYEQIFTIDGIGYYSSYLDDKIRIFNLENEEIYSSSFTFCEQEIVRWSRTGTEVVYIGYTHIIIEDIFLGTNEEYDFESLLGGVLGTTILTNDVNGLLLSLTIYPGPQRVLFDLEQRRFIETPIYNPEFITDDFIYHSLGISGDNDFIRLNRFTHIADTLWSNYTSQGYIRDEEKYYFVTEEYPLQVIGKNDQINSYEFDHGRLESAVETETGSLIFAEIIAGGTVIYELDIASSSLIGVDTIFSDKRITLLDSYQDRVFVKYSTQFDDYYGYMDPPYTQVEVVTDKLQFFTRTYIDQSQDLFIIEYYSNGLLRDFMILEKSTNEVVHHRFVTSYLWLDDVVDVSFTSVGAQFIVSEPEGKTIYRYDPMTNSMIKQSVLHNRRGLGTEVQKNEDNYLIANEHSLHPGFEYIHPDTKELTYHQVDGIIHGNVIPYDSKYFYIRNQDFQGVDENFVLDFVMFDPENGELELIEENFFYPNDNVSFSNINFTNYDYGLIFIYNTSLIFNLRTQSKLIVDSETRELLRTIYFETDNYFYSYTGNPEQKHYRIDKNSFEVQDLNIEGPNRRLAEINNNSFAMTFPDAIYYIVDGEITSIDLPTDYNPNLLGRFDTRILFGGFDGVNTNITIYDVISEEEVNASAEGYIIDLIGDYLISITVFEPIYELVSTNIISGETFEYSSIDYLKLYSSDSTIYLLDSETNKINILSPEWEEVESIDAANFDNADFDRVSEPNALPVIFSVKQPRTQEQYIDLPDYSLVLLDPRVNTLTEYFGCESNLRFNKAFEIDSTSYMLLRTEEEGYQVFEVELPGFTAVSVEEPFAEITQGINVNPNPTSGFINIDSEYDEAMIFNSMGQLMGRFLNENNIDLALYPDGIYYLKITTSEKNVMTSKIIKY